MPSSDRWGLSGSRGLLWPPDHVLGTPALLVAAWAAWLCPKLPACWVLPCGWVFSANTLPGRAPLSGACGDARGPLSEAVAPSDLPSWGVSRRPLRMLLPHVISAPEGRELTGMLS